MKIPKNTYRTQINYILLQSSVCLCISSFKTFLSFNLATATNDIKLLKIQQTAHIIFSLTCWCGWTCSCKWSTSCFDCFVPCAEFSVTWVISVCSGRRSRQRAEDQSAGGVRVQRDGETGIRWGFPLALTLHQLDADWSNSVTDVSCSCTLLCCICVYKNLNLFTFFKWLA